MYNTKILKGIVFLSLASLIILASCKKKDDPEPDPAAVEKSKAAESDGGQTGTDNREVQEENDVAVNEINQIISESKRLAGRSSLQTNMGAGPCGLDVDSVKIKQDTILLKYNGVTCNNRTRTGVIRLSWAPGTKWNIAGATVKVDYLNYKIVRASDQRFVVLNGTQMVKNESGGTWITLALGQPLVISVTGTNLQVSFTDGKTATYNINRRATYSVPNGILTAKFEGIGNNGSAGSLENFGTTRNGDSFTSQVTTPIVWNLTCGGAVLQGGVTITNTSKNYSVSFLYGVDANGNVQTVGPNQCPYGWTFTWPGVTGTNTKVFAYK